MQKSRVSLLYHSELYNYDSAWNSKLITIAGDIYHRRVKSEWVTRLNRGSPAQCEWHGRSAPCTCDRDCLCKTQEEDSNMVWYGRRHAVVMLSSILCVWHQWSETVWMVEAGWSVASDNRHMSVLFGFITRAQKLLGWPIVAKRDTWFCKPAKNLLSPVAISCIAIVLLATTAKLVAPYEHSVYPVIISWVSSYLFIFINMTFENSKSQLLEVRTTVTYADVQ